MYLEIFLADFVVFCVVLGISRDFAEISEFRGSATARNIRSPDIWRGLFSEFYSISIAHSLSCGEVAIDIQCTCIKGIYEIHCTCSTCVC